MNKKVAIVSDIHFGVNKNSELFLNSSLKFFKEQFVPYLKKFEIGHILVLGDVFDNRNTINVKISDEVFNLFEKTFEDFEVTILIGNHDIYYKTSNEVHSLKALRHLPNVDVIDTIRHKEIYGVKTLFCPWIVDYEDETIVHVLETSDSDILFGHFDIVGFALNRTRVSTEGLHPEVFSKFKKVFSGHYHTPSSKRVGKTEIAYIGSPYQMNRNDIDEPKGFIVLNLETLRYKRIVNDVSVKFVEVDYPEVPSKSYIEGNIVDAIITIDKKDLVGNVVDKYIEKLEKLNPIERVNVVLNVNNDNHSDFDNIKAGMNSIPDLIEMYINNDNDIDDKSKVLNKVMEIYEEVT